MERFALCERFHCLPYQLDDMDPQELADFLHVMKVGDNMRPQPGDV